MSENVSSIKTSRRKTRRILAGVLAGVFVSFAPCVGAAPAAHHLTAKPSRRNQAQLMYQSTARVGVSGPALGQEALTSAIAQSTGVCVDPHHANVLLINLNVAMSSMVNAVPPAFLSHAVADVVHGEHQTTTALMPAIGILAMNLSR